MMNQGASIRVRHFTHRIDNHAFTFGGDTTPCPHGCDVPASSAASPFVKPARPTQTSRIASWKPSFS